MLSFDALMGPARAKGLEGLQLVTDTQEELSLVYFNGHLEKNETSRVTSMQVTALLNGQKASCTVEDEDASPEEIIDALYENVSVMNNDEKTDLFAGSEAYPAIEKSAHDYRGMSLQDKIALLADIEKKIRERESRVVQIPEIMYEESLSSRSITNSKGLSISKSGDNCVVMFELVASNGKQAQVGFKVEAASQLKDIDVDKLVDEAIYDAVSMFDAESIESGEYPVIIENEAMIQLLRSFSSMFTGEAQLKKISPVQDRLGQKVFSDRITIYDMPLKPDAVRREPFDDEGVACRDKTIVENGVFKAMLHDLKTAAAFGEEPTGNSFGGGIRGCNFFIAAGDVTKEDMIASMDRGLLLTGFDGLHAGLNPISGDMSLKTSGYFIENGAIARPVTLIVMAANFIDMMNDVAAVGSDLKLNFMGMGSPSVKFNRVSVSGK